MAKVSCRIPGLKEFRLEEMAEHCTDESCYMYFFDTSTAEKTETAAYVVDVTKFIVEHPGGPEMILQNAGKDISDMFEDIGHSASAIKMRQDMIIGHIPDLPLKVKPKKSYFDWGSMKPRFYEAFCIAPFAILMLIGAFICSIIFSPFLISMLYVYITTSIEKWYGIWFAFARIFEATENVHVIRCHRCRQQDKAKDSIYTFVNNPFKASPGAQDLISQITNFNFSPLKSDFIAHSSATRKGGAKGHTEASLFSQDDLIEGVLSKPYRCAVTVLLECMEAALYSYFAGLQMGYTLMFFSIAAVQITISAVTLWEIGSADLRDALDRIATPVISLAENLLSIFFVTADFNPYLVFLAFFLIPRIERSLTLYVAWFQCGISYRDLSVMVSMSWIAAVSRDSMAILLTSLSADSIFGELWFQIVTTVLLWMSSYIAEPVSKQLAELKVEETVQFSYDIHFVKSEEVEKNMNVRYLFALKHADASARIFVAIVSLLYFVLSALYLQEASGYDQGITCLVLVFYIDAVLRAPMVVVEYFTSSNFVLNKMLSFVQGGGESKVGVAKDAASGDSKP